MKVTYGAIVQRASGKFGGTVHSNWKGVDVVRRFAKPSNPSTTDQEHVRNAFRYLTASFLLQTTDLRGSWDSYVTGKPLINRNAWLGKNVPLVQGDANINSLLATPGDSSTLPPLSIIATPGSNQLSVDIEEPPLPAGWTIARAVAVACEDWNPGSSTPPDPNQLRWAEASDATSPYTCVLTSLVGSQLYYVAGFLVWNAPTGELRYSASIATTATPS